MPTTLFSETVNSKTVSLNSLTVGGVASQPYGMTALANITSQAAAPGNVEYTTPGTFSFIVPAGVTSISAVAIGAGASGGYTWANSAGSGGALAYANAIPVTPGQSISIVVPPRISAQQTSAASAVVGSFFSAQGGTHGATSTRAAPVSGSVAAMGGSGGLCSQNGYGGGGGAGGYTGNGGDGSYGPTGSSSTNGGQGSGGSAAGGTGYQSSTYSFGGGGGVGIYGQGSSGLNQTNLPEGNTWSYITSTNNGYGGKGGSGGEQGSPNSNSTQTFYGRTTYHGEGGCYGGGGAGGGTSVSSTAQFCSGAQGAVRIMWGATKSFPSNASLIT